LLLVEAVLVAAAFGGFDDDLEKLVAGLGGAGGALGSLFGEGLECEQSVNRGGGLLGEQGLGNRD
jgi:hypothetical protein